MMKILVVLLISCTTLGANSKVMLKTSMGEIQVELFDSKAPVTVKNFKQYVKNGFFDGTIFHRVIDNFMIQGGGFDINLKKKKTNAPIINEATNKLSNEIGTLAMARTSDINSATGQFFINVNNNTFLDHKGTDPRSYGYAVFGKVTKGMTVVNRIKKVATANNGPYQNVPVKNIVIEKATLLK